MSMQTETELYQELFGYALQQADAEPSNHSIQEEQLLLEMIREGAVDRLREALSASFPVYPSLFPADPRKSEEYMAVGAITLATRATIETGITVHECFEISDFYLRRIGAAASPEEVLHLRNVALISFATLVQGRSKVTGDYSYTEECRNYIRKHVLERIAVQQIADALNVNPIYLERLFKKEEGIPIHRFIQEEKIRRAQFFLTYTNRTLADISEYLGFSSQSHFSRLFREITGETPRAYRKTHAVSSS